MSTKVKEAIKAEAEQAQQTVVADAVTGLPVIAGTLPSVPTDAEMVAKAMAQLAEITAGLRTVLKDARSLETDIATVLKQAWMAAGPGNAKQFKAILSDCEAAILRDEKVEKWADLGSEARSYTTYKSHFIAYITELKASCPEDVDPVTLRRQVSRWYTDHRTSKGKGATAAKEKAGKPEAPQVQTGETDGDATVSVPVGLSKATIRVKGDDGKYHSEEVGYPTEVTGALAKLLREIGHALNDKVPVREIVEALQAARDMIGTAKGQK